MTVKEHDIQFQRTEACWKTRGILDDSGRHCPELEVYFNCQNCPVFSNAGRKMLDRPIPEDYAQDWTTRLARDEDKKITDTGSAFIFRTGGEWLALPASIIREVVEMGPIHSLPHRSTSILRGLVNIRGKLEICLSIGGVLGLTRGDRPPVEDGLPSPERMVLASRNGQNIVFPVSEILGIIRYSSEMIRNLPVTLSGSKAYYTKGIISLKERDVGFLNDELLFETLTRTLT